MNTLDGRVAVFTDANRAIGPAPARALTGEP